MHAYELLSCKPDYPEAARDNTTFGHLSHALIENKYESFKTHFYSVFVYMCEKYLHEITPEDWVYDPDEIERNSAILYSLYEDTLGQIFDFYDNLIVDSENPYKVVEGYIAGQILARRKQIYNEVRIRHRGKIRNL